MFYILFVNLHVVQKSEQAKYIYKLSSNDKVLSPLIKKTCRTCTFLNHFREANKQ